MQAKEKQAKILIADDEKINIGVLVGLLKSCRTAQHMPVQISNNAKNHLDDSISTQA